jgi:hypothetical protein
MQARHLVFVLVGQQLVVAPCHGLWRTRDRAPTRAASTRAVARRERRFWYERQMRGAPFERSASRALGRWRRVLGAIAAAASLGKGDRPAAEREGAALLPSTPAPLISIARRSAASPAAPAPPARRRRASARWRRSRRRAAARPAGSHRASPSASAPSRRAARASAGRSAAEVAVAGEVAGDDLVRVADDARAAAGPSGRASSAGRHDQIAADQRVRLADRDAHRGDVAGRGAMRQWMATAPPFWASPAISISPAPLPSRCAAMARSAPTVTTPVPPTPVITCSTAGRSCAGSGAGRSGSTKPARTPACAASRPRAVTKLGQKPLRQEKSLLQARLVDLALAAELGLERQDRDAVRLHAAIAAALADGGLMNTRGRGREGRACGGGASRRRRSGRRSSPRRPPTSASSRWTRIELVAREDGDVAAGGRIDRSSSFSSVTTPTTRFAPRMARSSRAICGGGQPAVVGWPPVMATASL